MRLLAALFSCIVACSALVASPFAFQQRETGPVAPFRIVGNIYYVGTTDPTAFLIATDAGHILIDTTYEHTAPMVAESIRKPRMSILTSPASSRLSLSHWTTKRFSMVAGSVGRR